MANNYGNMPVTGRSDRKQVEHKSTAMQAGIAPVALFADIKSVLNDTTKSGKQIGAVILSDAHIVHIADDNQPASAWHTLTNGSDVTPA